MTTPYQKAHFLLSVAKSSQLPPDQGTEIAIVGRSNAGKSSVLNKITHQKNLARVSKTPGRTQLINVFELDQTRRLTDLPGYGFAKAPLLAKEKWQKVVNAYIEKRQSLKGLIMVMDIRHPGKALDKLLLTYCEQRALPVHILLNKADKLSRGAGMEKVKAVRDLLTPYHSSVTFQLFSALKGTGINELHSLLNKWYDYTKLK